MNQPMNQTPRQTPSDPVQIAAAATGDRLDRWLSSQLPGQSRSAIQRWIQDGKVTVNGAPVRPGYRLRTGDQIAYPMRPAPTPDAPEPEPLPLAVLYEDADVLVINKEAGMVVHPAPGHATGTLVNAILHYAPELGDIDGEHRPGVVHRLDKDTSGVIIVAKHAQALTHLQDQFRQRQVEKTYLALVEGRMANDAGHIDAPIGRRPSDRKRRAVIPTPPGHTSIYARAAYTDYSVEARFSAPVQNDRGVGHFTLVRAHPVTGRTHQIRVHFAWLGHPVVGDPLYGLRRQRLRSPRLCLHAAELRLRLPNQRESTTFTAPLPANFQHVLDELHATSNA